VPETHDVVWTPDKINATWDFFSERRADSTWYFSSHAGRWIAKQVDGELPLANKRVLDFGSGRGDLLQHLFARGIAVQGFEVSEDSARVTAERFKDEPLFRGVTTDASELPSHAYDVVFLVEVIEHLLDEQIAPVLAEARRLLAPEGRIVVTAPNGEDLSSESVRCPDCGAVFHQFQHMRTLTPQSISTLFEANGFRTVRAEGAYWGLTPYAVVRTWLREGFRLPQPHLLYIGAPSSASST
jgi:2-polyprenyl-3-methyl-5-hydroxy-6-metoxy-1,4-benzoquinol methylase